MATQSVNPPPIQIPPLLRRDPESASSYNQLVTTVRQLYTRLSGEGLTLVDGTVLAPGLQFASEAGLGLYRPTAGVLGIAAQGQRIASFSVNGVNIADLPPSSAVYNDSGGNLAGAALTNGQILIGRTGINPIAGVITGTANQITVTNGPGSITLTISGSYAGQGTITTLGTITSGIWDATTIAVNRGGTGLTSYAVGDLLYATGATTLARLADVATGNVLRSGGVGVAPAWGKVDLTTDITGTLPVGNGGATDGNWTPTLTGVSNIDAVTAYPCRYIRVGNRVMFDGQLAFDATTVAALTQVGISLPVPSNFANVYDAAGLAGSSAINARADLYADTANDRIMLEWTAMDVADNVWRFTGGYDVI